MSFTENTTWSPQINKDFKEKNYLPIFLSIKKNKVWNCTKFIIVCKKVVKLISFECDPSILLLFWVSK